MFDKDVKLNDFALIVCIEQTNTIPSVCRHSEYAGYFFIKHYMNVSFPMDSYLLLLVGTYCLKDFCEKC